MAGAPSEVMAAAWKGRIPIMFVLAEDEASEVTPTPFFSLASRYSYLPSVSRAAVESFKESAVLLGPGYTWFEFNGVPLKWQYPIGALFDLYADQSQDLPFRVTIRFRDIPKDILPCEDSQTVETSFFSSLKQAMYLQYGSTEAVRDLPVSKQSELWSGVVGGNLGSYWNVWKEVASGLAELSSTHSYYPIRLLVRPKQSDGSRLVCRQIPILIDQSRPASLTLRDVLKVYVDSDSSLFPEELLLGSNKMRIGGVAPSLYTPISELYASLSYADAFLYVCIV